MRVGLGIDTHQLIPGKSIRLGGVDIPSKKTIKAHSDGDIIYHACADSIYGAAGLGDIGEHFPDDDSKNKGLDSENIIVHSIQSILKLGFRINNLDITILLESPKISQYKQDMRKNLAKLLLVDVSSVNIKASTSESLGFIGRGEGITCYSIVSLIS
ncbi:MAG: 2-C-methyl-D-erythritol 2,4-cyclodiphosphate synthase [Gammaproteobacteria bacterium]|nr:2-C-methyl-D-erythritol 2,4-cyclodiphosphate synthase [Gammaproteobacteria bacterium]